MWHDLDDLWWVEVLPSFAPSCFVWTCIIAPTTIYENITTFLIKLCQPCVHGAQSIISFLLEILNILHLISMNIAPYSNSKRWQNCPMGQINGGGSLMTTMALNVVWQIHDIKDMGSNGSTWSTSFEPLAYEYIKLSWELVLVSLGFGMVTFDIVAPSLKVVIMSSMCCVQT